MFRKFRYYYRFYRLKRLLKRLPPTSIVQTKFRPSIDAPLHIAFGGQVQLGLFLDSNRIQVYVHKSGAIPFVIAHLVLLLRKLGSVEIRGIYNAPEIDIDRPVKGKQQLTLVKD